MQDSSNRARQPDTSYGAFEQPPHPSQALPGPPGPSHPQAGYALAAQPHGLAPLPEHWNEGPPGVEADEAPTDDTRPDMPAIGPVPLPLPPPVQPPQADYTHNQMQHGPLPTFTHPVHAYPPVDHINGVPEYGALDDPPATMDDDDLPPGVEAEPLPAPPEIVAATYVPDAFLLKQYSYDSSAVPPGDPVAADVQQPPWDAPPPAKDVTTTVLTSEEQRKAVQRQRAREEQSEAGESRRARLMAAAAAAALQSAPPPPPRKPQPPAPKLPPKVPKEVLPEPSESGELVCSDDDEAEVGSKAGAGARGDCKSADLRDGADYNSDYPKSSQRGSLRPIWGDRPDRRPPSRPSRGGWH